MSPWPRHHSGGEGKKEPLQAGCDGSMTSAPPSRGSGTERERTFRMSLRYSAVARDPGLPVPRRCCGPGREFGLVTTPADSFDERFGEIGGRVESNSRLAGHQIDVASCTPALFRGPLDVGLAGCARHAPDGDRQRGSLLSDNSGLVSLPPNCLDQTGSATSDGSTPGLRLRR